MGQVKTLQAHGAGSPLGQWTLKRTEY